MPESSLPPATSIAKAYHHGDLRSALVAAALDLLAAGGPDALSLRAVARQAGVSAMAPYRHYADKEALLAAVAIHGFKGLQAALSAADAAVPPDAALTEQAVAYVRYALANPALFRLMFGPRQACDHSELITAGKAAYAVLSNRVADQTEPGDREALTLGCWSLVHGLASLFLDGRINEDQPIPNEMLVRRVAEAMLLRPNPAEQTPAEHSPRAVDIPRVATQL